MDCIMQSSLIILSPLSFSLSAHLNNTKFNILSRSYHQMKVCKIHTLGLKAYV